MKQFITQFSLRQTTVAMMTGVSQPYISKLLNGNHRELSLRCRKNIYSWYLNCRRHPEKLGGRPIRSQRTPMKEITTLDDPAELDEFMAQGEEGCINDMKQFITQFSLRQTTVAMMTGVSQPYISKLLNGNHRELSLRCRKNIYSWYLNCRRHPEKLAFFLQDPSTRLETDVNGDLVPQRRERYVFRPILIKILESYFAEMPFPDYSKRAEIAAACNKALQMDKKGLMPKEIVSAQVVANWFANKRKEMRRKSNEDTLIPNGANLPSPQMENGTLTSSPVDAENHSIDFLENLNNLKSIFNLSHLYVKQNSEGESVSQSSTPPSSAELDKLPSNLLSSLLAAYQQPNPGLNFVKIEQTAE
uniref:Homeobox domain-containing protein n=1 Tax=Panagrolaimus sp. JU765 TaxID=591449 RepID=A0AC34QXJ1_9BILA